jgi:hypothetical protein
MAAKKKAAEPKSMQEQIRGKILELHMLLEKAGPTIKCISWDWKSSPDFDELNQALWPFGIYVYPDPAFEGQDSYGYIFSDRPLSEKELRAVNGNDEE